jgi:hypothetical protein
VDQRAGDLGPPALAARQRRDAAWSRVGQADLCQNLGGADQRLTPGDAMQGGVIGQVLRHRQIGIQRARLKHHAQPRQGRAGRAAQVMAGDADMARAYCRKAG